MNKRLSILILVVLSISLSACITPDSAPVKPRYEVIDAEMAKVLFDRGALFIDLRIPAYYEQGRIPGAVNLTWGRRFNPTRLAAVADPDREIVIYCYGINCDLSGKATESAVTWGYTEVYYFVRGFPAWTAADYPVEES